MQLQNKCTTSGAIVNYQSGGPSSAHDGGAAFLFALERLHATFTATCHNGAIRAPAVSVANTPTCEDVGNTSGESDTPCHIAGANWGNTTGATVSRVLTARAHDVNMTTQAETGGNMAGKPRPGGKLYGEMLNCRVSPEQRIALSKLAHRRRQSVSDTLRALIAQATATQRTTKSAAAVATPTNELAAK